MTEHDLAARPALVIGESLIDIVEHEGRTVEHVGGSPANVAIGLARLGHPVRLLTRLGSDARGERIAAVIASERAELLPQSWGGHRTSTARARISADGSAEYEFDIDWRLDAGVDEAVALAHTGSIALFLEPGGSQVLELLERLAPGTIVTLDPNIRPSLLGAHDDAVRRFERAAGLADVVKLSDEDAAWLYPTYPLEEVAHLIRRLGPSIAVITLGAEGALAASEAGITRVPAREVRVVDTISAGDSFMASLVSSLLECGLAGANEHLRAVLERAAHAAAIAVSAAGANPPRRDQLEG